MAYAESPPSASPERHEIVFSPGGSVHALNLNSPSGTLYGGTSHHEHSSVTLSEFGADRTYGGESYAELYAAHQREARLPPSALRRSTSMARTEDTPGKLRRKVSFHVTTVRCCSEACLDLGWLPSSPHPAFLAHHALPQNDFTSRVSLRSVVSGASVVDLDTLEAAAAPSDTRAASCLTHLLAFMGGSRAGPGCCEPEAGGRPEEGDETVERMRRSLSSQLAFSQDQEGTRTRG
jgi:hypothetical protein